MFNIKSRIMMYLRMNISDEKTIEQVYSYKKNSFNIVRLLLAISVIYSHSYPLLISGDSKGDLLGRITHGQIEFGSLAVYSFFVISGFLITQSMLNSKNYSGYIIKRCLRIFPAFLMALIFSAFIIGPIVSKLSFRDYFLTGNTIEPIRFVLKNLTMNVTGYSWGFLDVFAKNPFPGSVDGSMWTLKHEFACYIMIMIFSFFYIFKNRIVFFVASMLSMILAVANIKFGFKLFNLGQNAWVLSDNEYNSFIVLACYFIIGALMYIYKDKIKISYRYLLLAFILILFSSKINNLQLVMLFALPYLLIGLCVITNIEGITKYGDFSYGMYIYAFPIQQTLVYYFGNKLNILSYFVLSTGLVFILAVISWYCIERPALKLKNNL